MMRLRPDLSPGSITRSFCLLLLGAVCLVALVPTTARALDPHVGGEWSAIIPWPHVPVSMAGLPDGRVLTFASNERDAFPGGPEFTYAGVWDPVTLEVTEIAHPSHDMFCASLVMLEDGNVFISGGRNKANSPWTSLFDFRTDSWIPIEEMNNGRWYPTSVALPTGQVFIAVGDGGGDFPEIWTPGEGWTLLTGMDMGPPILDYHGLRDGAGLWPLLQLDPLGTIFYAGATPIMHRFDPFDGALGSVEVLGPHNAGWFPDEGVSVLFDEGKLLIAGGSLASNNNNSSNQAMVIDVSGPAPVVTSTGSMQLARQFHNEIMLPTGEVLVVGGNSDGVKFNDDNPVLEAEVYDPDTGTWRLLNPQAVPRTYHSTATLLVDGRVLSAGGGLSGNKPLVNHWDGEIFTPWYLFNADGSLAARPEITAAPNVTRVGATFPVEATAGLDEFSLIKLSATTHTMNTDQRFLRPTFIETAPGEYEVTLHANENVLTPGFWMLYALDSAGVPSVSAVIQIVTDGVPRGVSMQDRRSKLLDSVLVRIEASDPDGNPITYSATGLPDGLSLDAVTGMITGTLTTQGTFGVVVTIDDGTESATVEFNWFVTLAASDIGTIVVDQTAPGIWHTHAFPGVFQEPVVVMGPPSLNDADPVTVRVRNVTSTGFEYQLDEWDYLDGVHGSEQISFLVIEAGAHQVPGGGALVAGRAPGVNDSYRTTVFPAGAFTAPPVLLTQAAGDAEPSAVTVRARNLTATEFEVKLQREELGSNNVAADMVHWIAVDAGVISSLFEAAQTASIVDEVPETVTFSQPFSQLPHLLASSPTTGGGDPGALRADVLTTTSVAFVLEEEASEDTEIGHADEAVAWMAIDASVTTLGLTRLFNAAPTVGFPGDQLSTALTPVSLTLLAQDDDGDGVTFEAVGLPSGLSIDPVTGEISGSPDTPGDFTVTVTVTDPGAAVGQTTFDWLVGGTPTLEPFASPPAEAGSTVDYTALVSLLGLFEFTWDFGDGTPAMLVVGDPMVSHQFLAPGRFIVTLTVSDSVTSFEDTLQFVQIVHAVPTAGTPARTSPIVYDETTERVWVVNPDNDTVTVIDASSLAKIDEIAVADRPRGLAVAGDGRVWVTAKDAAQIDIVDPGSLSVVQSIPLQSGSRPHGILFDAAGGVAYVALEASGDILKLDGLTGALLDSVDAGPWVRHLALSADGTTLYAPRFITPPVPGEHGAAPQVETLGVHHGGEVLTFDTATLTPGPTSVLHHGLAPTTEQSGPGIPNYLGAPAISPDGSEAWIPSKMDNILRGTARDGLAMVHDSAVRSITSRIVLATGVENELGRVDHDDASLTSATVFDPSGAYVYSALEGTREIAIMDPFSGAELGRMIAGHALQGIVLDATGETLYAYNFMDRTISVHDLRDLLDYDDQTIPTVAVIDLVANETLAADVLSGKRSFYDAFDTRLTLQGYMSCATCHNEGGHDGRTWDFTQFGEGFRNTIGLEGHGVGHGPVHWTANFDEIQDFEGQIRAFAGGSGLMADADFNAGTRSEPLGDPKAGLSSDLDALAAYMASLTTVGKSPFRDAGGALSPDASAGRALFAETRTLCGQCHSGPEYTDSASLTKHLTGTAKDSLGAPLPLDTPTLLGLWNTGPYLHDGSALTVRDAIERHAGLHIVVTPEEMDLLAAYLLEIDDDETPPTLVPEPGQLVGLIAGLVVLSTVASRRRSRV